MMRTTTARRSLLLVVLVANHTGAFSETITLEEAVRLAAVRSPAVREASVTLRSAQADVSAALAPYQPKVTASAGGRTTQGVTGLSGSAEGTLSVQAAPFVVFSVEANAHPSLPAFSASSRWTVWPPHSPSEDALSLAAAQADRASSSDVFAWARVQAALKARHLYRLLQIGIERTVLAEEAASAARVQLERDEGSVQQSTLSRADLLKSRRDEAEARLALRKAADLEAAVRRALERHIGAGQFTVEAWRGVDQAPLAIDPASLRARAEENSPAVLAARRRLALAQTQFGAAQERHPFSVHLQAGVERPALPSEVFWTFAVQGSYDLADGGKVQAATDKAGSDLAAAQLALESARYSLLDTLARHIEALEEKALEIESLQFARDRARVLHLEAVSKVNAGALTADDLAVSRRGDARAQLDLDTAVVDYQYLGDSLMQGVVGSLLP